MYTPPWPRASRSSTPTLRSWWPVAPGPRRCRRRSDGPRFWRLRCRCSSPTAPRSLPGRSEAAGVARERSSVFVDKETLIEAAVEQVFDPARSKPSCAIDSTLSRSAPEAAVDIVQRRVASQGASSRPEAPTFPACVSEEREPAVVPRWRRCSNPIARACAWTRWRLPTSCAASPSPAVIPRSRWASRRRRGRSPP